MSKWPLRAAAVVLVAAGCASENEPASETQSYADPASASADHASGSAEATPRAAATPELNALVAPAAEGLPEVRYYSLGGT